MAQQHTTATMSIQRRLERWELDHLRALCAVQAEEIERLQRELQYAEDCCRHVAAHPRHHAAFNLVVMGITLLAGFYIGGGFQGGK